MPWKYVVWVLGAQLASDACLASVYVPARDDGLILAAISALMAAGSTIALAQMLGRGGGSRPRPELRPRHVGTWLAVRAGLPAGGLKLAGAILGNFAAFLLAAGALTSTGRIGWVSLALVCWLTAGWAVRAVGRASTNGRRDWQATEKVCR